MSRYLGERNVGLPARYYSSPLTADGFVRFVNVHPDRKTPQSWICDECYARVTTAKQAEHVRNHR